MPCLRPSLNLQTIDDWAEWVSNSNGNTTQNISPAECYANEHSWISEAKCLFRRKSGAGDGIRTRNPQLGKLMRYRCATPARKMSKDNTDFIWMNTDRLSSVAEILLD